MTPPPEPLPRLAFPPLLYLTAFALGWLVHRVAPLVLFLPVFAVIDWRVIRWEERNRAAKFGAPYLDYLSRVPRWI